MIDAASQAEDAAAGQQLVPAAEAAPDGVRPNWTQFDLGTALQELRSVREGVMRMALRKLHQRWWHAPAKRMKELLSLAGCDSNVLDAVQDIVDTCRACRQWTRPGIKAVASVTNAWTKSDLVIAFIFLSGCAYLKSMYAFVRLQSLTNTIFFTV